MKEIKKKKNIKYKIYFKKTNNKNKERKENRN